MKRYILSVLLLLSFSGWSQKRFFFSTGLNFFNGYYVQETSNEKLFSTNPSYGLSPGQYKGDVSNRIWVFEYAKFHMRFRFNLLQFSKESAVSLDFHPRISIGVDYNRLHKNKKNGLISSYTYDENGPYNLSLEDDYDESNYSKINFVLTPTFPISLNYNLRLGSTWSTESDFGFVFGAGYLVRKPIPLLKFYNNANQLASTDLYGTPFINVGIRYWKNVDKNREILLSFMPGGRKVYTTHYYVDYDINSVITSYDTKKKAPNAFVSLTFTSIIGY
jgi:hypothetical protein